MNFLSVAKYSIIKLYRWRVNKTFNKKIKTIYSNILSLRSFNNKMISEHLSKWKILDKGATELWYKVFSSVRGIEDINYVPENIYYNIIEPCLNNKYLGKSYSDKNFYEFYYKTELFPDSIIRNIDEVFYNRNYERINLNDDSLIHILKPFGEIIIKPAIDSGGGDKVNKFSYSQDTWVDKTGNILSTAYLNKVYKTNYIIQECLEQHTFFSRFNKSSFNTIRIFTYRSVKDDSIIILHSILRAGKKGMNVDNQASGGTSCGIRIDGTLNHYAVDKYGNKSGSINDVDLSENISIPKYSEMKSMAVDLAKKNIHSRLLGLDFGLDIKDRLRLFEINNLNNEINFYQMNNGSLFGEYTNEVIDYCKTHLKTFVIDYNF